MGRTSRVIDLACSQPHYERHVRPVWEALPETARGADLSKGEVRQGDTLLASSWSDVTGGPYRHRILMEHGAGQGYGGLTNPHYVSGRRGSRIDLTLVPNEQASSWLTNAETECRVIGAPGLDWSNIERTERGPGRTVVAHHWDCRLMKETVGGWQLYRTHTRDLGYAQHAHPRIAPLARSWSRTHGVDWFDYDEVMHSDVLVADNTSILFEFAALTHRPVVVLQLPWYQTHTAALHGGFFGKWSGVGVSCHRPEDLEYAVDAARKDPIGVQERRREVVEDVYPVMGEAAVDLAVEAIVVWSTSRR